MLSIIFAVLSSAYKNASTYVHQAQGTSNGGVHSIIQNSGSSLWNLLHVTFLETKTWRWLHDFWTIGLVYCKQTLCMSQRTMNKVSPCLSNTPFRCTEAWRWLYSAKTLVYAVQCNVNYGIQVCSTYGCFTNTHCYISIPLLTGQVHKTAYTNFRWN